MESDTKLHCLHVQEEQRLVSNREGTRDAWFRQLREASSAASRGGGPQRDAFGSSHVLQDIGVLPQKYPSQIGLLSLYRGHVVSAFQPTHGSSCC